jgi:hypothetical protein
MEELVWRKEGDGGCERSYRTEKKALAAENDMPLANGNDMPLANDMALANTNDMPLANDLFLHHDGFHVANTKREEASAKLSERYLVGQPCQNPFMPTNNYVNDLEVQMNFLTPQKSK